MWMDDEWRDLNLFIRKVVVKPLDMVIKIVVNLPNKG
jgi:hypothetical protein